MSSYSLWRSIYEPLRILKLGFWLFHRIFLYNLYLFTRNLFNLHNFSSHWLSILFILKILNKVPYVMKRRYLYSRKMNLYYFLSEIWLFFLRQRSSRRVCQYILQNYWNCFYQRGYERKCRLLYTLSNGRLCSLRLS